MDQENIVVDDDQQISADEEQVEELGSDESSDNDADSTESEDESSEEVGDEHSSDPDAFKDEKIEIAFQKRLARAERKLEREISAKYSQPYNAPMQNTQYIPQQPNLSHLPVEQQEAIRAEMVINSIVDKRAAEQIKFQEEKSFLDKMRTESAKDEDFDDFFNFDIKKPGMCTVSMLEAAQKIGDPRVLFEFHKANPAEYKRLVSMSPMDQAIKLAEFKAKRSVAPRKVQSSAPRPIQDPSASSRHATKLSKTPRDRLNERRSSRRGQQSR